MKIEKLKSKNLTTKQRSINCSRNRMMCGRNCWECTLKCKTCMMIMFSSRALSRSIQIWWRRGVRCRIIRRSTINSSKKNSMSPANLRGSCRECRSSWAALTNMMTIILRKLRRDRISKESIGILDLTPANWIKWWRRAMGRRGRSCLWDWNGKKRWSKDYRQVCKTLIKKASSSKAASKTPWTYSTVLMKTLVSSWISTGSPVSGQAMTTKTTSPKFWKRQICRMCQFRRSVISLNTFRGPRRNR